MPGHGALDQARALLRKPDRRHDLRRRPLPADVGLLLALVGNDPAPLKQAAGELGMDPAQLQEAARFYVQEVLLFPGADDYRLLGVTPGVDKVTLKRHYRMLQSWLHPDRASREEGLGTQAARINAAYRTLRHLAAPDPAPGRDLVTLDNAMRTRRWVRVEDGPEHPRRLRRLALAALALVALGGGLWLARQGPKPPAPASRWAEETRPAPTAASDDAPTAAAGFLEALSGTGLPSQAPEPGPDPQPLSPPPALPEAPPGASAVAVAPTATDPTTAADPTTAPAATPATRPDTAPPQAPATPPVIATPPVAAASPGIPPSAPPVGAQLAGDPTPPAPAAPATPAAPITPTTPLPPDPRRADQAERRAEALFGYLTQRQAVPPPIWRSAPALDAASAARHALAAERGSRKPQVLHARARWQYQDDLAVLAVPVQPADRSAPRLLHARLRWHDQDWWVESVALDPAPASGTR